MLNLTKVSYSIICRRADSIQQKCNIITCHLPEKNNMAKHAVSVN